MNGRGGGDASTSDRASEGGVCRNVFCFCVCGGKRRWWWCESQVGRCQTRVLEQKKKKVGLGRMERGGDGKPGRL